MSGSLLIVIDESRIPNLGYFPIRVRTAAGFFIQTFKKPCIKFFPSKGGLIPNPCYNKAVWKFFEKSLSVYNRFYRCVLHIYVFFSIICCIGLIEKIAAINQIIRGGDICAKSQ